MGLNKNTTITVFLSAIFGALIWIFSPLFTGQIEPWDSQSSYYYISLFSAGVVAGFAYPKRTGAVFSGVVLGQFLYLFLFLSPGLLALIGIGSMLLFGTLSLAGAIVGTFIGVRYYGGAHDDERA